MDPGNKSLNFIFPSKQSLAIGQVRSFRSFHFPIFCCGSPGSMTSSEDLPGSQISAELSSPNLTKPNRSHLEAVYNARFLAAAAGVCCGHTVDGSEIRRAPPEMYETL